MSTKIVSRFSTVIPARGSAGNVFAVLGSCLSLMRQVGATEADRAALTEKVMGADSYKAACDAVREWFPVDTGGEDDE